MMAIVIIVAVLIILTVWACCKASAKNTPYPCRNCQCEYCDECEYWKGMVADDGTTA